MAVLYERRPRAMRLFLPDAFPVNTSVTSRRQTPFWEEGLFGIGTTEIISGEMKLSRIEANWIASKLLSDAERERELSVAWRTAWIATLYPALRVVRPTERMALLRAARNRASKEPQTLLLSIAAILTFAVLLIWVPQQLLSTWLYLLPGVIGMGALVSFHLRTRAILRVASATRQIMPRDQ